MKKIACIIIVAITAIAVAILSFWLIRAKPDHIFRRPDSDGAPAYVVMQEGRWDEASIRPSAVARLDKAASRYLATRGRYKVITAQRRNGVPAPVIFVLHGRESGWSFSKHLHNGNPLTGRTYQVPAGRLPDKEPPYTFEESAEDSLYVVDGMHKANWSSLGRALQAIERYNGLGYQNHYPDIPSPYLWAGTTIYYRGKYVRDGVFDPLAVDRQLGCAAIIKRMEERGIIAVM